MHAAQNLTQDLRIRSLCMTENGFEKSAKCTVSSPPWIALQTLTSELLQTSRWTARFACQVPIYDLNGSLRSAIPHAAQNAFRRHLNYRCNILPYQCDARASFTRGAAHRRARPLKSTLKAENGDHQEAHLFN